MSYRLGIDIGTNSIGWSALDLDDDRPIGIRDIGVRIFHDGRDPQSGTSLAVERRAARSMRRRRDRYLLRRKDLMRALVRHGLMPGDETACKALESLDPYELRARGLDEKLGLHELGRAIFHLSQRRGFRSNRKTDRGEDDGKESGKVKAGGERLEEMMRDQGARTLGEFLYRRHKERKSVRARLTGQGAKAEYDFYPQRAMLEAEFTALWKAQARHHAELTDEARDTLFGIVFRQRPLRPVEPGKCALDPAGDKDDAGGFRAPWALPIAQRFRIYQELANLRLARVGERERPLTMEERDKAAERLFRSKTVGFKALKKALGLAEDTRFNLESPKRDHLDGDETAAVLSHKDRFGKTWHDLDGEDQAETVERLLASEDEDELVAWLRERWGLDAGAAASVARARLPQAHCRLGRRALGRIVPVMRDETEEWTDPGTGEVRARPITYDMAARKAGYHHSDRRPGDVLEKLPYYGEALERHVSGTGDPGDPPEARFGRIPNPTVHIGLNQTRRLVNALIDAHGPPAEIVVELARELKLSRKQKDEIQKEQAENQKRNDRRREKLGDLGLDDHGENRMRLRLWEELNPDDPLDRRCVYTGEQISLDRLFTPAVEIEHILPFARTLDNSAANRTVSMRHANRAKGNLAPFEAFGHNPTIGGHKYDWQQIQDRAAGLAKNKQWRFGPDAMERFEREERGFLDRQLTDTAYLARVTREYLGHICDPNRVRVIPGRLTALLRGKWGLNSLLSDANLKNRVDHRHHAIDAVVAAVTDRSMLQRIATAAGDSRERLIDDMPEPWGGFRDDLRDALAGIVVSHKPDHGRQGKLHEETAYGPVADPDREDGFNLVYRKALVDLNENEVKRVRDPDLRRRLDEHLYEAKGAGLKLKDALAKFSEETGVRRVRLLKKKTELIEIAGSDGRTYKAYIPGENFRVEIFEKPDGSWGAEAISMFHANRLGYESQWQKQFPTARAVMRVHKGDLLKLKHKGIEETMRVVKLAAGNNTFWLAGHTESGNLQQRHDDPDDPFRWFFASFSKLKDYGARKVSVDELGRVRDPGPPE